MEYGALLRSSLLQSVRVHIFASSQYGGSADCASDRGFRRSHVARLYAHGRATLP